MLKAGCNFWVEDVWRRNVVFFVLFCLCVVRVLCSGAKLLIYDLYDFLDR